MLLYYCFGYLHCNPAKWAVTPGTATSPTVAACTFDNDVPALAQTAQFSRLGPSQLLQFQAGIAAGEGCSPVVDDDFDPVNIIDLCTNVL